MPIHLVLLAGLGLFALPPVFSQSVQLRVGQGWDPTFPFMDTLALQEFDAQGHLIRTMIDPYCSKEWTYDSIGRPTSESTWCYESSYNGTLFFTYNPYGYLARSEFMGANILQRTWVNARGQDSLRIEEEYDMESLEQFRNDTTRWVYSDRGLLREVVQTGAEQVFHYYTSFDSLEKTVTLDLLSGDTLNLRYRTFDPDSYLPVREWQGSPQDTSARTITEWFYDGQNQLRLRREEQYQEDQLVRQQEEVFQDNLLHIRSIRTRWEGTWNTEQLLYFTYRYRTKP